MNTSHRDPDLPLTTYHLPLMENTMNKFTMIISAALFAGQALATGDHGNTNGPKNGGNSTSNAASISGSMSSSKAESRASAAASSTSGSRSSARGGHASAAGGNATGGAGGNAIASGGEGGTGGHVIVSNGGSGSGLNGRMVPDVSTTAPLTSTSCRNGITAGGSGNGWGGLLGFFSEDDICEWRILEQNYRATGDHDKANAIRNGMTLQRCEKLAPREREMFGDLCPKPQATESQNVAFQSN